jgi:two-component sensor histidine kinase
MLPYGKAMLHIKAQAADGKWSKNELLIQLNMVKPVYLQLWFLLCSGILLFSVFLGIYRWRLYLLKSENLRLDKVVTEKTNDLRVSLNQKDVLLKEIHHRVKNNLQIISSLLRLQSRSVVDNTAREALIEGQNRIASIALIHQKLYQNADLDSVEFSKFANDLFQHLSSVFTEQKSQVDYANEMPIIYFEIDVAVPLALILNELITNSYKYAFTTAQSHKLRIKLEQKEENYVFIYSDNGPGLPVGIDPYKSKSMGLRLINRLSGQIGAVVTFHNDNGLTCNIELKSGGIYQPSFD